MWQLETQKGLIFCQKKHSPDCKVLPQNEAIFIKYIYVIQRKAFHLFYLDGMNFDFLNFEMHLTIT
jgi:hypothetical protein